METSIVTEICLVRKDTSKLKIKSDKRMLSLTEKEREMNSVANRTLAIWENGYHNEYEEISL